MRCESVDGVVVWFDLGLGSREKDKETKPETVAWMPKEAASGA
jgi:hypothetical protein